MQLHALALAGHNKDYQPPRVLTSLSHVSVSRGAPADRTPRKVLSWVDRGLRHTLYARAPAGLQSSAGPCGPKTDGMVGRNWEPHSVSLKSREGRHAQALGIFLPVSWGFGGG